MSIISLSLPPLQQVKTMYYLPVDFYRYLIGREDQSVNEQVMIKRIDQQLKVNRLLVDQLDLSKVSHPQMREYLLNHIEITTVISSALLNRAGTAEHLAKKRELWTYIQQENPEVFQAIRKTMLSRFDQTFGLASSQTFQCRLSNHQICLWI